MTRRRVAAASLNQTPLDWAGNTARIVAAIEDARQAQVDVLCLPELAIPGYGCEDMFFADYVQAQSLIELETIASHCGGIVVAIGLPLAVDGVLYNAAALCVDGRVVGLVCKQFLAGDGIHYEPRWFSPWPRGKRVDYRLGEDTVPCGDVQFFLGDLSIVFEICRDGWVADRPVARFEKGGVDIVLNPSASHFAFGKRDVRDEVAVSGSRALDCVYVMSNLNGCESGRILYDGACIVAQSGRAIANARPFHFRDSALLAVDVELAGCPAMPGAAVVPYTWSPAVKPVLPKIDRGWLDSEAIKEEEFSRAIALGLFDYLRKSRAQGFVVSLSGGADSAAVSCAIRLMVDLALAELGAGGYKQRLAHISPPDPAGDARGWMAKLLLGVYQSTRNSSTTTREAARTVAQSLGADFMALDVDAIVTSYTELVQDGIGHPLSWEHDDIALQNIQARARGPSVWMLANLRGALLLATSNRSEAAVGYATMDGDTCGGLSPIAGIDKAFLRQWLCWLEQAGPRGSSAFPWLSVVNSQAPTAELRPRSADQRDEEDLMPYEILDAIERSAIRDKRAPAATYRLLCRQYPAHDTATLAGWVEKFFQLWARNQWKRERYAPCFHVDDANLDPKTWCRFPILSSGFASELAKLRDLATG